jgi:N utilization substance protein B
MLANKRKARELAMQVLFLWDANGASDDRLAAQVADERAGGDDGVRRLALKLASEAWNGREAADQWMERLAPQWPPRRQPGVDRSILRLAIHEMTGGQTPPKVAIDEAIELAKAFSTEQSPGFVNGVLDAILREYQALTGSPGARNQNDEPMTKPE